MKIFANKKDGTLSFSYLEEIPKWYVDVTDEYNKLENEKWFDIRYIDGVLELYEWETYNTRIYQEELNTKNTLISEYKTLLEKQENEKLLSLSIDELKILVESVQYGK